MPKHESAKIKKGDAIVVLAGKNAGKRGKVIKMIAKKDRVLVERVNMIKKHQKPAKNSQGGIVEKEAGINISNVALFCTKCNKGVRIGHKVHDDGVKVRVCKSCGEELETK
jgi:large subunit ribosomal protein L24